MDSLENLDNFIEAVRKLSLTAEEFIENLNFILERLGKEYYEVK